MKKALGHLTVMLVFGAIWPFLAGVHDPAMSGNRFEWLVRVLGHVLSPDRDLTTIVLVLVLVVAQSLAVVGLSTLLRPLGRALLAGLSLLAAHIMWPMTWLGRNVHAGEYSGSGGRGLRHGGLSGAGGTQPDAVVAIGQEH